MAHTTHYTHTHRNTHTHTAYRTQTHPKQDEQAEIGSAKRTVKSKWVNTAEPPTTRTIGLGSRKRESRREREREKERKRRASRSGWPDAP